MTATSLKPTLQRISRKQIAASVRDTGWNSVEVAVTVTNAVAHNTYHREHHHGCNRDDSPHETAPRKPSLTAQLE